MPRERRYSLGLELPLGGLRLQHKEASKGLSRLHMMGFLVREREKRLCISKNGKQCHKGYSYEYAFSSQREKIHRVDEGRIVREETRWMMMRQLVPYLSEDDKDTLLFATAQRAEMRYKGPSREAQDLGLLMVTMLPRKRSSWS
jgi:hypothetical protein